MHIDAVPNRDSRPTYLLRESFRDGKSVRKRTLANLSELSDAQIAAIRLVLRGEGLCPPSSLFEVTASRPAGHVQAVAVAMRQLQMERLLAARPSRERDLVVAMVAARIVAPTPSWPPRAGGIRRRWPKTSVWPMPTRTTCTRPWTGCSRTRTRSKRSWPSRHLPKAVLVLYDLSSSYFEGSTCPLAKLGYSRDGRKGMLQVNYGLLTDARGCPVAVSVYEGNVGDSLTLMPEVQRLRQSFGIEQLVMVGDRGMISQKSIDEMRRLRGYRLDQRAQEHFDSRARRARAPAAWVCLMSATCSRSAHRTIRASAWWPAAIRSWPSCARTSARICSRRPSATWRRSRPGWMRASSAGRRDRPCEWAK
jgi:hypothetical protein